MSNYLHALKLAQTPNEGNCIHGVRKETCSQCSGYNDTLTKKEKARKEEDGEIKELKNEYDALGKYDNYGEDWSEEEYEVVYNQFKGIASMRSKGFRKLAYQVALQLGRTRKSIVWHYKHMFMLQDNAKGGKKLMEFKAKVGLSKKEEE